MVYTVLQVLRHGTSQVRTPTIARHLGLSHSELMWMTCGTAEIRLQALEEDE